MATSVNGRPEWLPDEYEHVEVTREEIRVELDKEPQRHRKINCDELRVICRDPPEQYHGDPALHSRTYLAHLLAEPGET